jgi:hypothetical protein
MAKTISIDEVYAALEERRARPLVRKTTNSYQMT